MKKKISILLALGLLLAAVFLSGPQKIISSVLLFRRDLIVPVLALSLANYLTRFVRWHYLTRVAGIKLSNEKSILIFLTSFLFSIAPAKSGDLVKPYYLKKYCKTKYSLSVPVIFLERVYDVLGIIVLISFSGALYMNQYSLFAAVVAVLIATSFISPLTGIFLNKFHIPFFGRWVEHIKDSLRSSKEIFSIKTSFISLGLGTIAWFFECTGLYFVVFGFGVSPDIVRETLIYSASTLGGAISMLPGGLGATEGGMAYLMSITAGVLFSTALSITLVIRAFTLWFAVLIGFFANLMLVRTEPRKKSESIAK